MRLKLSLISGAPRFVALRLLASGLVLLLAVTGCVEVDNLREAAGGEAQRELQRFRAKDMDYARIVDKRKDVRKYIAQKGMGTIDREGDPLSRYLDGILRKLIAASPVPDLPARVVVLDLQSSPVAEATLDGTIYIPFRLLADMSDNPRYSSEDALAFLLAHELSHVLHYHFQSDVVGDVVEAVKVGTELSYSLFQSLQGLEQATGRKIGTASMMQKMERFYKRVEVAQLLEESALTPAFTREQEDEADLLAFDLMIEAGYNPDAAYDFMDLLREYEEVAEARRKEKDAATQESLGNQKDLNSLLIAGVSQVVSAGLASMKRKHASATERRSALGEYHDRWADEISDAEDIPLRRLAWKGDGRVGDIGDTDADTIGRLFANYAAARNAEVAIGIGDHAEATTLLQQALSEPTMFNAYPRIVAAIHHEEKGERAEAVVHIRAALRGPGPAFNVYEEYLRRLSDEEERLAVLDEAQRTFGPFVRLMRLRATTLENLGREEEARRARSVCYSENALSKQRSECRERLEL